MESALKIEAEHMPMLSTFKSEQVSAADEMEADNDALMREFQNVSTPQALRRLSENISWPVRRRRSRCLPLPPS